MNIKNSFKTQIIALSFFTAFSLVFTSCKKDNLQETQLEDSPVTALPASIQSEVLAADGITSSSYYLVNSLPSGYVKDGSVDYTSYVQAAVTKYANIVFPGFPILVNDQGIMIGSNKTITFQDGSELRLKASSKSGYDVLKIYSASNVTLYNPVIVGDRTAHIGTSGEWGMGIGIYGSNTISIYNPKVTNCWGDGIYIGQVDGTVNSKDIVIKNAYLRNNRRDGISIIGVEGLLLDKIYAGYNAGTAPGTGINIEANNAICELKNIRINDPHTEYNGERGIQVTAHHILSSNTDKHSDITIVNHLDIGSPSSAFKLSLSNKSGTTAKMYGLIKLVNPSWQKTVTNRPLHVLTDQLNYKIAVSSPEVINASGTLLSWSSTYSLLMKAGANVSVASDIDPAFATATEPAPVQPEPSVPVADNVVFAVNAGGASFKASNGITYSADKNYSRGSLYKTTTAIANTADDVLYQSERYGNFSYNVPLANGTYEITFKVSENYHKVSGKRKFDVLAESKEIVSDLDIFAVAGSNTAYDVVKTVSVTDGTLNLDFRTDLDQAKVSAFHIIKK
jgi:hypothetical protein